MPTFPIQPAIRRARVSLRPVRWLGLLCAMLALGVAPRASASATSYYVSPGGSDASVGTSINQPFRTIQRALDVVRPGDVVNLAAGVYAQDFRSRRGGTASAPITITGPSAAIVKGGGAARVGLITHDYLTLSGFTIDGLFGSAASASGYRDLLLEIVGAAPRDGVTGLKLLRMTFRNAGGTCVRLRSFAQHSEIAHSRIGPCGVSVFRFATGAAEGAGLAIGTAPEQRDDGTHPDANPDESSWNWVHDTLFDTQGGACVAIAAAATGNLVESNRCTGQREPSSGGFDSRGSGNVFRYNESWDNAGAGFQLGGDDAGQGVSNDVYGNSIHDNRGGGIRVLRSPQGRVCGNPMRGNLGGDVVGTYGSTIRPTAPCDDGSPGPASEVDASG